MTREDILRQMAVLQTQLDEFDKAESRTSVEPSSRKLKRKSGIRKTFSGSEACA